MMSRTVGVIGLGAMGFPMALRVAAAGHRVLAVEANPDRCDDARAAGLEICDMAKLADTDIVLVMVATEAQLTGPAFGKRIQRRIDHDRAQVDLCCDLVSQCGLTERPHRGRQCETRQAHQ